MHRLHICSQRLWGSPALTAHSPRPRPRARPAPSTHVTSGPAPAPPCPPPSALLRSLLGGSAPQSLPPWLLRPSSASPPAAAAEARGRLPGWPRATVVASASRQWPPQEEARRSRSHLGPQFSPSCSRRGSWRSGSGRGTGRRGSRVGERAVPYLRMRRSHSRGPHPLPPPSAVSHSRWLLGLCPSWCVGDRAEP